MKVIRTKGWSNVNVSNFVQNDFDDNTKEVRVIRLRQDGQEVRIIGMDNISALRKHLEWFENTITEINKPITDLFNRKCKYCNRVGKYAKIDGIITCKCGDEVQ